MVFLKEDWVKKRRLAFDRYKAEPTAFNMASPENPPFEGISEYNPDKVTMANSTAYKMEKQFLKLGLFDSKGAITPLGTGVERLRAHILQYDGVGQDDLLERFDSETIEAALKSGQIRKARKLLYF